MANSKGKCSHCRQYYPADVLRKFGLSGVCSDECLQGLIQKAREKHARKEAVRERKTSGGPRLGGTTRKKVRERDKVCVLCGNGGAQIHHVVFRSQGGKDSMTNLVLLCAGCHHEKAHGPESKFVRSVLLEYLRRIQNGTPAPCYAIERELRKQARMEMAV